MSTSSCELIITQATWRTAVQDALQKQHRWITARLLRSEEREPPAFYANSLVSHDEIPSGALYPPLADWLVIHLSQEPIAEEANWLRSLQPRFAQVLVALVVGLGKEQQSWQGWIVERERISRLESCHLVGPRMIHLEVKSTSPRPVPARWERLAHALGPTLWEKVRQSRVGLIGCSRNGSLAAYQLAALGVEKLVLCDDDRVEPVNLDAMLALPEDIGQPKAVALARRLAAFRPDMAITAIPKRVHSHTAQRALAGTQLLLSCVDDNAGRLATADLARKFLIPHLDIGTLVQRGTNNLEMTADVRLLLPGGGQGCVRCVGDFPGLPEAEYQLHAPPGALPRRPPPAWNSGGRVGSLLTWNSVAVGTGIQLWLDLLAGHTGTAWVRLRWLPGQGIESQGGRVTGARDCVWCGEKGKKAA